MQRDELPNHDDFLYIEYSVQDENKYSLHLNFQTSEKANIIFEKMLTAWGFTIEAVEIHDNRITLLPAKDSKSAGIIINDYEFIGIRLPENTAANELIKFIQDIKNNEKINKIAFIPYLYEDTFNTNKQKIFYIHTCYLNYLSLEKRIQQIEQCITPNLFPFFALHYLLDSTLNLPKELIYLIMQPGICNMPDRLIELNKHFSLFSQQNHLIFVSVSQVIRKEQMALLKILITSLLKI